MAKRREPIEHEAIVQRFADRLRELRSARGMTQLELATSAGIAVSYAGRLERAGAAPGIDLLARLATALGVTPHDLLPLAEQPDEVKLLKSRAKSLLNELLEVGDKETLQVVVPFLARVTGGPSTSR
jgi:transcriptional regulator with XRE-family HTH domain